MTQLYISPGNFEYVEKAEKVRPFPPKKNFLFVIFWHFSVLFFRVIFCRYETNSESASISRFWIPISDLQYVETNSLHTLQSFKSMNGSKNQENLFVHESEKSFAASPRFGPYVAPFCTLVQNE
jgi:hypothetical protein